MAGDEMGVESLSVPKSDKQVASVLYDEKRATGLLNI